MSGCFLISIVNRHTGWSVSRVLQTQRAFLGSFCIHTPDRAIAKNRAGLYGSSCCARQRHDAHQGHMRPQLRSSSLPSSGLFLALSRAGHECMHWRASSAHHRCLGPFGATRVLVTHHRLHLLELLEVEVSALAAEGGRSTRRALEALKRHSARQSERHSERHSGRHSPARIELHDALKTAPR
jgi:hypothetical protein